MAQRVVGEDKEITLQLKRKYAQSLYKDDGSTLDKCENNQCIHDPDPLYCELPQTSVLVINELMAAPGDIPDTVGEWIEILRSQRVWP